MRAGPEWLQASAAAVAVLARDPEDPLRIIADTTARLLRADLVAVVTPAATADELVVEVGVGDRAANVFARKFRRAGSPSDRVMHTGVTEMVDDVAVLRMGLFGILDTDGLRHALVLAVPGPDGTSIGAVVAIRRTGAEPYDDADTVHAETFLAHAAGVLHAANGGGPTRPTSAARARAELVHSVRDTVLQRLFGVALTLETIGVHIDDTATAQTLHGQGDELRGCIAELRMLMDTAPPIAGSKYLDASE